jgi:hypothetical protein
MFEGGQMCTSSIVHGHVASIDPFEHQATHLASLRNIISLKGPRIDAPLHIGRFNAPEMPQALGKEKCFSVVGAPYQRASNILKRTKMLHEFRHRIT